MDGRVRSIEDMQGRFPSLYSRLSTIRENPPTLDAFASLYMPEEFAQLLGHTGVVRPPSHSLAHMHAREYAARLLADRLMIRLADDGASLRRHAHGLRRRSLGGPNKGGRYALRECPVDDGDSLLAVDALTDKDDEDYVPEPDYDSSAAALREYAAKMREELRVLLDRDSGTPANLTVMFQQSLEGKDHYLYERQPLEYGRFALAMHQRAIEAGERLLQANGIPRRPSRWTASRWASLCE
eukprot:COSAG04_NODE_2447_length_4104_cov_2.484894_3_plen_240_part_00